MRYESFLWLEENYWRIEWLTGELLWGARPDNIKRGMMTASRSKLSCTKIKGLVPWPTFPEGTTQESFRIGQTTYCKPKFNQLRRDSTYSWKKVGVELPKVCAVQLMFHQPPCSTDRLFPYHSMDASCLCHACEPAVSGRDEVETWWYTGTTGIVNKWRWLLECRKDGQSNRKLSTFQQRQGISTCCIMVLRGQSSAFEKRKWNRTSKGGSSMKPIFSKSGCSRMVRSSKPGRSAALLAYTQRPRWLQIRNSLSLKVKTAITQDVWLFPLQLRYELSYTYWA